jgi:transcriptional regulator with XRE-family HTH domain
VDVAAYLRAARGIRRMSQRRLADVVGVPRSTLDRIEAGNSDPRLSTLTRIFGALGYELTICSQRDRPLRLDETREQLIDGRGRHFPPHWEYEEVTAGYWGNWRKNPRTPIPRYTYWFRHPSIGFTPWEDAT